MCIACAVQSNGVIGLAPYVVSSTPFLFAATAKSINKVAEKTNIDVKFKVDSQKVDKLQSNFFNYFLIFLTILVVLPFIAPLAASAGIFWISEPIYFVYSFMCHQFHWRSLHVNGHQVAWCTRDTFIWTAFWATAMAFKYNYFKKSLRWYWIIPFMIPIALDGGIQTIATILGFSDGEPFYLSTNFMRMLTGSIFGIGLGMVIAGYLKEEQDRISNF